MIGPAGVALSCAPGGERHLSGTVADVAFRGLGGAVPAAVTTASGQALGS